MEDFADDDTFGLMQFSPPNSPLSFEFEDAPAELPCLDQRPLTLTQAQKALAYWHEVVEHHVLPTDRKVVNLTANELRYLCNIVALNKPELKPEEHLLDESISADNIDKYAGKDDEAPGCADLTATDLEILNSDEFLVRRDAITDQATRLLNAVSVQSEASLERVLTLQAALFLGSRVAVRLLSPNLQLIETPQDKVSRGLVRHALRVCARALPVYVAKAAKDSARLLQQNFIAQTGRPLAFNELQVRENVHANFVRESWAVQAVKNVYWMFAIMANLSPNIRAVPDQMRQTYHWMQQIIKDIPPFSATMSLDLLKKFAPYYFALYGDIRTASQRNETSFQNLQVLLDRLDLATLQELADNIPQIAYIMKNVPDSTLSEAKQTYIRTISAARFTKPASMTTDAMLSELIREVQKAYPLAANPPPNTKAFSNKKTPEQKEEAKERAKLKRKEKRQQEQAKKKARKDESDDDNDDALGGSARRRRRRAVDEYYL